MTAPNPTPAEQAVIDRFGIFEPERAPDPLSVLDQLDEAHAKATPGPWAQHPADLLYVIGDVSNDGESYVDVADTIASGSPDAALIVAAVNAVPALTAAVRAALALHVPAHDSGPTSCVECRTGQRFVPWPCPTYSTVTAALAAGGADQ